MNATDIALLCLGSYFVIRGLFKGFSGELISLVSVIGGFCCALLFCTPISDLLSEKLDVTPLITTPVTMVGIFCVIFALCAYIDKLVKRLIKGTHLTGVDKAFGALAGFLKIYVIALLLLVAGTIVSPLTGDAWIRESRALVAVDGTWPILYPALDHLGVLPDLATLQQEARIYVTRQAANRLFGPEDAGDERRDDRPPQPDGGADPALPEPEEKTTQTEEPGLPQPDEGSPDAGGRSGGGLMDFFREWGKDGN